MSGEPEAGHRAPELAEVVAARALLGDFGSAVHEFVTGTHADVDWLTWSLRLSQHMAQLLAAMQPRPRTDGSIAATHVRPDGSAILSPADLLTVLSALRECQDFTDSDSRFACAAVARALGDQR